MSIRKGFHEGFPFVDNLQHIGGTVFHLLPLRCRKEVIGVGFVVSVTDLSTDIQLSRADVLAGKIHIQIDLHAKNRRFPLAANFEAHCLIGL